MKKTVQVKNLKLCLTVIVALVLLALLVPFAYARYVEVYLDNAASAGTAIGTDLSGNAAVKTDIDNLFIHMMNEALPVGSIYMTQLFSTTLEMKEHFGGDWDFWGTGRAPAGVNVDSLTNVLGAAAYSATYPAAAAGDFGGEMNDPSATFDAVIQPHSTTTTIINTDGYLTLTKGSITRATTTGNAGSLFYAAPNTNSTGVINTTTSGGSTAEFTTTLSNYISISGRETFTNGWYTCSWPSHGHTLNTTTLSFNQGTGEAGNATAVPHFNDGSATTWTTTSTAIGGGTGFGFRTTFTLDWWTPTFTAPIITYTAPSIADAAASGYNTATGGSSATGYLPQYWDARKGLADETERLGLPVNYPTGTPILTAKIDTDTVTGLPKALAYWRGDETVQPYVVVYMFKRTALADLR